MKLALHFEPNGLGFILLGQLLHGQIRGGSFLQNFVDFRVQRCILYRLGYERLIGYHSGCNVRARMKMVTNNWLTTKYSLTLLGKARPSRPLRGLQVDMLHMAELVSNSSTQRVRSRGRTTSEAARGHYFKIAIYICAKWALHLQTAGVEIFKKS